MSDIYLQITETPTVVTLSAPVVASVMVNTVTVANVVSVNVVTMPSITVQAAAPSVTTVAGTVTIGSCVTHGVNVANSVSISSFPAEAPTWWTVKITGPDSSFNGIYTFNSIGFGTPFNPIEGATYYKVGGSYNFLGLRYGPYGQQPPLWSGNRWAFWDDDGVIFYDDNAELDIRDADFNEQAAWTVEPCSILPVAGQVEVSNLLKDNNGLLRISGTVTVGNSVTIGSLPVQLSTTTIGGTARLNVTLSSATTIGATAPSYGNLYGGSDGTNLRAISVDTSGRTVVTGSVSVANTVPVSGTFWQATQPVSGTVTANIASTTVTISAQPSGALTTRFGSVVTANTAGITTAVTNTSRKYLLAQNISAGTVTIGIGFSPTTTQGIQLTSGAGLTFDSFVPTGAVYWLGATTGAAYTILEG
jgi:hypothetical protein